MSTDKGGALRCTSSGLPLKPGYTPEDVKDLDYSTDLGDPGSYPFTRGNYPPSFRDVTVAQRPVLGYGLPEDTNQRLKTLLQYGMQSPGGFPSYNLTGDMPSAFGYDSDDPSSAPWVGLSGPPINSIKDTEATLEGIPLEGVYHGALSYAPNWRVAHYIALADLRGIPRANLIGATLNNSLHGPIGEGCHVFPPRQCLRLIVDTLKFVTAEMPHFRACDVQAYSSREAGCNAIQEAAFAIADMTQVMKACIEKGLDVDEVARHLTFFYSCNSDFFEEIAKFRAARKVWAQVMRDRFKPKNNKSCRMKAQVKTSACTLPAQYPSLNLVRSGYNAMAAVLGGAGGMNITALDESYASPTERTARLALLTGKVLDLETGVGAVTDPLAGSYYVEHLTKQMEEGIWRYLDTIEGMGGYVAALENGYLQQEIASENARYSAALDKGDRKIVGLNIFEPEEAEEESIEVFQWDTRRTYEIMCQRLQTLRKERDQGRVGEILAETREAVRGDGDVMPLLVEASKAHCTIGEVYSILRQELGEDKNCLIPLDWQRARC